MGKSLLIVLFGFAISFGIMANGRNRRFVESVDRIATHQTNYSLKNASASGAYMALSRLYLDSSWRDGYTNLALGEGTINLTINDNSTAYSLKANEIRIWSTGQYATYSDLVEVMVFDGSFDGFAVWAKDDVAGVTTQTAMGLPDTSLLIQNAPFMPDIDYTALVNEASNQHFPLLNPHVHTGAIFTPSNGYPNGNYYYSYPTPNVSHVLGDLHITGADTVYGVFIVEGDVILSAGAKVEGVVYSPNAGFDISATGQSSVTGGVVTWGEMDGTSDDHITVQYDSDYLGAFVASFVPNNPPVRVLSWR